MKKLDFSKVEVFAGISKKTLFVKDIREVFADAMYSRCIGLKAHALAFKIYNSKGEEEYSDEEIRIINECAENFWSPNIIDAIRKMTS